MLITHLRVRTRSSASSTSFRHAFTLNDLNRLIRAVPPIPNHDILRVPATVRVNNSNRLIWREIKVSLAALLDRDERIVEPGQQETDRHEKHGHVGDEEAHNLAGIVAHGAEGRVREAEDDGQDGH